MRRLHVLAACAALVATPSTVRAQISEIAKLFSNLSGVGGFWVYAGFLPHSSVLTGGGPSSPKQSGMQGPGLVFTFEAGTAGTDSGARRLRAATHTTAPGWAFHFAVAYSQVTGFRSQSRSFDLRGSIRELPRLAWFAQWRPERRLSPYFGLHMGLVELRSVAIYDSSGAYFPVGGSTWEVGVAMGLATNFAAGSEGFNLFVEPGYTLRNVVSLDWGGGAKTIPARFPRSLRFTGWEIAAGIQFRVPRPASGRP
jgi:hypothetical protein